MNVHNENKVSKYIIYKKKLGNQIILFTFILSFGRAPETKGEGIRGSLLKKFPPNFLK